jgi:asparagine synthase (glutamine-hydrolysing)
MCGITGLISRSALSPAQVEKVRRVNDLLVHRGPDGTGSFLAKHLMLAMRRLSIVDLEGGWQPLYNETRELVLIANGEVYNHVELRAQLEARGHVFATHSDCEVILHAYEEYGATFVDRLRGMYAFALWDGRTRRLMLVRDRMGEKPLYFAASGESLFFASELRALVKGGVVPFKLDPQAVDLYYHYGYVPEPNCMVMGIRKLPAAHMLTLDLDSWSLREHCYWRMSDAPPLHGNPGELIREQLEQAAQLVTRADVPVGVALSGGLDASAIAALAVRARKDVHAFTVGYAGTPWQDERGDARAFAEHLHIPIHTVELSTADVVEQYSAVNFQRDDPISDSAGVSIAAVAQLARRHSVPVLLFGQGGDELFWGYRWMRTALRATRRRALVAAGLRGFAEYVRFSSPPLSFTLGLQWARSGAGILSEWRQFRADRRATSGRVVFYDSEAVFSTLAAALHGPFYTEQFRRNLGERDLTAGFTALPADGTAEVTLIRLICETYLAENGIAQSDRLAMAASVESRLPLVDYRLVETVIGLHKTYPVSPDAAPKQWFRDALGGLLPDFVLERRKRGFSPPWRQWGNALAISHGDQLIDGYLVQNGILRPEAARKQRQDLFPQMSGPRPLAGLSLGLEDWCRQMSASQVWEPRPHGMPRASKAPSPQYSVPQYSVPQYDAAAPIGVKTLQGSVWMIGATGTAKALGLACQLALAWFLTQKDYGIYAIAISLSVFLSVLRDGGLPMVLEQKGSRFDEFAGPAFWMMLAMNCATGLLIAGIAEPAAKLYQLPELADLMLLFAATIPLSVVPSMLSVRLAVDLKFRELGLIQMLSALTRNSLLLLFAWRGFGARSLLLPALITSVTDSLLLLLATRYSPWKLRPRFRLWPELFAEGRWILLGTFSIGMGNTGSFFVLGKFLPSEIVGTYFFAYQLVVQLGVLLSDNVYQVLVPSFARISQDIPRLRAAVLRALRLVVLVGAAASLSIAAIYGPAEQILWHGKWAAASHAVQILAVVWPAAAAVSVLRALHIATGHFRQWGLLTSLSALACIFGTVLGAYGGRSPATAAVGFGVGVVLGAWLNAAVALPHIGAHPAHAAFSVLRPWVIIAGAALCAEFAGGMFGGVWLEALASAACFAAVGFIGLRALAKDSLRGVHMALAQIMRRGAVTPIRNAVAPIRSEST